MTEVRTISQAQSEANDALRAMRTSYLYGERARGIEYLGLASVSITEELQRRQAEFMAKRTIVEMVHDTGVWVGFAERTSEVDCLAMANEALAAIAAEQVRRCGRERLDELHAGALAASPVVIEQRIGEARAQAEIAARTREFVRPAHQENGGLEWWQWFEGDRFVQVIHRDGQWFLRNEPR